MISTSSVIWMSCWPPGGSCNCGRSDKQTAGQDRGRQGHGERAAFKGGYTERTNELRALFQRDHLVKLGAALHPLTSSRSCTLGTNGQ